MTTALALSVILFAAIAAVSAAQAQTAPGKPRITRVIEADFAKEAFTIRWRPPVSDGGSPIIGYYIYRSQHRSLSKDEVPVTPPNAYPTRCDELTPGQWRITSGSGELITDPEKFYTAVRTPSSSGQSWGNCYRWHIIAVNSVNNPVGDVIPSGPQAITDPIYSRGYKHEGVRYSYDRTHNNSGAPPAPPDARTDTASSRNEPASGPAPTARLGSPA